MDSFCFTAFTVSNCLCSLLDENFSMISSISQHRCALYMHVYETKKLVESSCRLHFLFYHYSSINVVLFIADLLKYQSVMRNFACLLDCGPTPKTRFPSKVDGNQVSLGSVVKYTCTYDTKVFYITCQAGGTWSEVPPCVGSKFYFLVSNFKFH